MANGRRKLKTTEKTTEVPEETKGSAISIPKPQGTFDLGKFASNRAPTIAGVATLLTALPTHKISGAKDFVRLHPDESKYWSPPLCFVNVPIRGVQGNTMHLIVDELATLYLPNTRILRHRLALATEPDDIFFLCSIPTENLDNAYNETNHQACHEAKHRWVQVTNQKARGVESYKIDYTVHEDAFPAPNWPKQSLNELIAVTFAGRMIDREDHPGLLRLIGARVSTA